MEERPRSNERHNKSATQFKKSDSLPLEGLRPLLLSLFNI
jgi:hypothetical protein